MRQGGGGGDQIPFDSPLDQSLGSPASTRDLSSSPFVNYEFDFSGAQDAIMFPDHGTQQMHNDSFLASVPLFNDDLVQLQAIKEESPIITTFPTPSQQKEEHDRLNGSANSCDFSFDAMTTHGAAAVAAANRHQALLSSPSPSVASSYGSQGSAGINQLAAVFVREYARTHVMNDIDVLLAALRLAGIDVSDDVVNDILAGSSFNSASAASSSVSSPISSQGTSCGHYHGDVRGGSISPSVSPMVLPSRLASPPASKTRSSLQATAKDQVIIDARYGKRFVCDVCEKQFDRAFNLRTHALTHIDPDDRDKPFMCPWSECAKGFSRKYDAERHYRSVHLKKGEIATKKQVEFALSGRHGVMFSDNDYDNNSPSNG
ncbi:hypothetical protein CBS101457_003126 [Exobasidium rhododendri]|nr:hypothetical protein CBS101457_003126 [Exobasidium rhododendri]